MSMYIVERSFLLPVNIQLSNGRTILNEIEVNVQTIPGTNKYIVEICSVDKNGNKSSIVIPYDTLRELVCTRQI